MTIAVASFLLIAFLPSFGSSTSLSACHHSSGVDPMRFFQRAVTFSTFALILLGCFPQSLFAQHPARPSYPYTSKSIQQMVATAHPLATHAALDVLRQGGNAMDAAITAAFVLAVVEPYSSGLGGGGFLLVYDAQHHTIKTLDFRERAPLKARPNLYSRYGRLGKTLSKIGRLAVGVPGMVAGMEAFHKKYASRPWKELLEPARRYASRGFHIDRRLANFLRYYRWKLRKFRASYRIFYPNGRRLRKGSLLRQRDLGRTLKRLQLYGAKDFYHGRIARYIVREMRRGRGIIRREDLRRYRVFWGKPVQGHYRGFTIYSMGSPSSGGVHLIQILNILSGFPLPQMRPTSAERLHLVAEAMRLAFADRSQYQGDARFVKVPIKTLLSMKYARFLRRKIHRHKTIPEKNIKAGNIEDFDKKHTTHISIVDRWHNAVSMTLTINTSFGSGVVARHTGIILNNEMDDFTANPGKPNAYDLIQSKANEIQPLKTPLSSMTPTLVFRRKKLRGVLGSPGGPSIITTVAQLLLNLIDQKMTIEEALLFPRIHHQWRPPYLFVERRPPSHRSLFLLKQMGHHIKRKIWWGNAMGIWIDEKGHLTGGSDPRGAGLALGF